MKAQWNRVPGTALAALLVAALLAVPCYAQQQEVKPTCDASVAIVDPANPRAGWAYSISCSGVVISYAQATLSLSVITPSGRSLIAAGWYVIATNDPSPHWDDRDPHPFSFSAGGTFYPPYGFDGCLEAGQYTYRGGWAVDYRQSCILDALDCPAGLQDAFQGGTAGTGTFEVSPADTGGTVNASLLNPPVGTSNVVLKYTFGPYASNRWIFVDSGAQALFVPDGISMGQFQLSMLPGKHTFTVLSCGVLGATTSVTVPPPSSQYTVTGQILDGSAIEIKNGVLSNQTIYAQVPLGLELQLGLKKDGQYVRAKYTLSPATLTGLATPTLYPTNVVIEYSRFVHDTTKTFLGVHIGTQTLTVTPDDATIPPFTFTLGVFDPGALGNTDVALDPQFVTWGNKRGIPPHILKGLIRQEGPFDPFAYRYEPISKTTGDRAIQTLLATVPYSSYLLRTSTGLPEGALISDLNAGRAAYTLDDDVSPRKVFVLERVSGPATHIRPLDVCPAACVSARQIFEANDDKSLGGTGENWSSAKFVGQTDWWDNTHLAMLEFTAQTPTAASFGLMQTMYIKAIELGWRTTDGRRNPSLLFDTADHAAVGGGSLAIGTREFYSAYRACNSADLATDPDFKASDDYRSQIVDALNWYNHGNANRNTDYGDNAWAYSQRFLPSHPLSRVFP